MEKTRRELFLNGAVILAAGVLADIVPAYAESSDKGGGRGGVQEVQPVEDLMREHGLLQRILLIYEEGIRRIASGKDLDPAIIGRSAGIVRDFFGNYHEKLEEEYVFPKLQGDGLVEALIVQHIAGRKLTQDILSAANREGLKNSRSASMLKASMAQFIRMYRPHAAREDTVVFQKFKKAVDKKEYGELGELFEKRERGLFGENGFERMVSEVAGLEKALGIYEITKFTPEAAQGAASGAR